MIDVETRDDVLIKAGEWVTCENGHRICQCVSTQYRGIGGPDVKDFAKWHVEPDMMKPMPPCYCGAKWTGVRHLPYGGKQARIHIENRGWSA